MWEKRGCKKAASMTPASSTASSLLLAALLLASAAGEAAARPGQQKGGGFDSLGALRFRNHPLTLADSLADNLRAGGRDDDNYDDDSDHRLLSLLALLRGDLQRQALGLGLTPAPALAPGGRQVHLSPELRYRMKKAAEEFVSRRPQRENRRYLLWRKITG